MPERIAFPSLTSESSVHEFRALPWKRISAPPTPDEGGEVLNLVRGDGHLHCSYQRGETSGRMFRLSAPWKGGTVFSEAVEPLVDDAEPVGAEDDITDTPADREDDGPFGDITDGAFDVTESPSYRDAMRDAGRGHLLP